MYTGTSQEVDTSSTIVYMLAKQLRVDQSAAFKGHTYLVVKERDWKRIMSYVTVLLTDCSLDYRPPLRRKSKPHGIIMRVSQAGALSMSKLILWTV